MTKSQLISDIILRVTKGKPADDLELEPKQVEFWINMVLDGLVKDSLDEKIGSNDRIPDFYVVKESCKKLYQETYECVEDDDERIYVELKKPVLEILGDNAVVRVTTNEGTMIHKSRLSTIDFISNMEFAKPSTKNLVYYRDGKQKLVICGIPSSMIDVIEIFAWYVPQTDLECFDDEEELPIPSDLIEELQIRVEEIARRQMYGTGDVENDGQDDLPNVVDNG